MVAIAERQEVYRLIDGERNFQDEYWGDIDDSGWSPTDWCVFIRMYLEKAEKGMIGAESVGEARRVQMENIRKIAALAVAAMENNETPAR